MPGDADESRQSLVARLRERLDRATRCMGGCPLVLFDQVVELDEIDGVDAHALQRAFQRRPGAGTVAVTGLGGEEELRSSGGQPRRQPQFGIAVTGGNVEVVDAELVQDRKQLVGALLAHAAKRRGAEDHSTAQVSGATEWLLRDHGPTLRPTARSRSVVVLASARDPHFAGARP